jgi:Concanavalin A-like lectin/glucanases superfamily
MKLNRRKFFRLASGLLVPAYFGIITRAKAQLSLSSDLPFYQGGGPNSNLHLLSSLVAYWKLDSLSANVAADATGNGNSLTGNGLGNCSNPGIINNGWQASSSTGNLEGVAASTKLGSTDSLTLNIWIGNIVAGFTGTNNFFAGRFENTGQTDYRLGWVIGQGFQVLVQDTNGTAYGGGEGTLSIPQNTWWMLTVTYDHSTQTLKVIKNAGQSSATFTSVLNIRNTIANFSISNFNSGGSQAAPCVIDEVGIWTRVLSTSELTALYNAGSGLPYGSFTT